jgi:hypothetical protein
MSVAGNMSPESHISQESHRMSHSDDSPDSC